MLPSVATCFRAFKGVWPAISGTQCFLKVNVLHSFQGCASDALSVPLCSISNSCHMVDAPSTRARVTARKDNCQQQSAGCVLAASLQRNYAERAQCLQAAQHWRDGSAGVRFLHGHTCAVEGLSVWGDTLASLSSAEVRMHVLTADLYRRDLSGCMLS